MDKNDQRIREYAYQIWQMEGCPDGQDVYHWERACKLAEAEEDNYSLDMTNKNNFEKDRVVATNTPPSLRENQELIDPPESKFEQGAPENDKSFRQLPRSITGVHFSFGGVMGCYISWRSRGSCAGADFDVIGSGFRIFGNVSLDKRGYER
ncbi:hypothetical protein FHR87_002923 [Azomonas macrocytogenes]|uniref:DUF2934 domain-containing protein n=1 Tax=Azomonas macrocytogenes TaxID=69962 RepID=A0A839TA45_AZOMA|nr:hypothetical protein [Azomonas macrocytogenes]